MTNEGNDLSEDGKNTILTRNSLNLCYPMKETYQQIISMSSFLFSEAGFSAWDEELYSLE